MNLELRKKWLLQQKELFGNSLYFEQLNNNSFLTVSKTENNELITNCLNCSKGSQGTNLIFGIGNPDADFVFISETLSEVENFDNKKLNDAEKLFENIISAISLNIEDIYQIFVLKCTIDNSHFKQCISFLKSQLKTNNPKLIIGLGKKTLQLIPNVNFSMDEMRKKIFKFEGIDFRITYHPDELLENSNLKRPVWEDFKNIKANYLVGSKS